MRFNQFYVTLVIFFISACSSVEEQDFFEFKLQEVNTQEYETIFVDSEFNNTCEYQLYNCVALDTLIIAEENHNEFHFSINNINTGDLVGLFVRKGRGEREFVTCAPLKDIYIHNGEMLIELFSYQDSKLLTWNITKSLKSGRTVYDNVINLKFPQRGTPAVHSTYTLNDNEVIVYNSMQNPFSTELDSSPAYEIYNKHSGELVRSSHIFNKVTSEVYSEEYTPSVFMNNYDCIKPDRSKIVMAMAAMPVVNIINLSDFTAKGFKLIDKPHFSIESPILHYIDVQSTDEYIYALYLGSDIESVDYHTELHIIDWEGNFIKKVRFNMDYEAISLTKDVLYLYTYSDVSLYSVNVSELR